MPASVEEVLLEDNEYYRISNCSLTEFLEPTFIESFVKNGDVYCLSDRNCIIQNCAAVTPNGVLTLHILEFIYQTLGLEGTKRPHNYYEVSIDLKKLRHTDKLRNSLKKLEYFDFYISWEPRNGDICPSSIAKYFNDRNITVTLCTLNVKKVTPTICEIPTVHDTDVEEMVEWVGLLAHNVDFSETENYISTYSPPISENSLKSTRISVLIVKGLFTPTTIVKACKNLSEYVASRDLENYWTSISVQSWEDSPWRWNVGSPMMFQSHDSTCNIFFTHSQNILYSVGQLKYS
ncbi:ribonuclease P protein subunit p40-like [Plodia interpunctella]|uniref:ribonuclease P protein subunit p40-like n=1 Tax=Plodia interpunctella TaxID=58824 RepID=UPI002368AFCE|nr:ribonuclease P protein subunit p40-like [Plodia interpunctella]